MKRLLHTALIVLVCLNGFGQKDSTERDSTNVLSLLSNEYLKYLPNFTPQSPSTASIQKFKDFPVNLASGVANISIPIYIVQSGSLSLPINLRVHTAGHKIEEMASWVGYGMSLDLGTSLTRTVEGGLADDPNPLNAQRYLSNPLIYRDLCNIASDYNLANLVHQGLADVEPDLFHYSTTEVGGRFFLGQNGQPPFLMPYEAIQLQTHTNAIGTIEAMSVIAPSGNEYYFGKDVNGSLINETQNIINHNQSSTGSSIINWQLGKILSPNTNDSILLFYQNSDPIQTYSKTWHTSYISEAAVETGLNSQSTTPSANVRFRTNTQSNIKTIFFENGKIEFTQSDYKGTEIRTDQVESAYLKQITVYNSVNGNYEVIKNIQFFYSYFLNGNNSAGHLKLDSIRFADPYNFEKQVYSFSYFTNSYPWVFKANTDPSNASNTDFEKQDFFGYYNGKPNSHLIAASSFNNGAVSVTGGAADRSTIAEHLLYAQIKSITYPSGSKSIFEFEPNKYKDANTIKNGSGLRIKTIKTFSGIPLDTLYRRFEYSSEDGDGVGKMTTGWNSTNALAENYEIFQTSFTTDNGTSTTYGSAKLHLINDNGWQTKTSHDGTPLFYTQVKEYFEKTAQSQGFKEYTFDFTPDIIIKLPVGIQNSIRPWLRGNTISEKTYDANLNLKSSVINTFTEFKNGSGSIAAAVIFNGEPNVSNCPSLMPTAFIGGINVNRLSYFPYPSQTGAIRKTKTVEMIDGVSTTRFFNFDQNLLPDTTTTENSITGHYYQDINIFPSHSTYNTDPIAMQMRARNMIAMPLWTKTRENLGLGYNTIYQQKTVYNSFAGNNARGLTNNILPAEIWVAPMGQISEKRVEFKNYDSFGNLLTYEVDGQPTTLVWGYNNSLVNGIVKNATLAEVNSALSSSGLSPLAFSVSTLSTGQENTLQNFGNALPNSLIDWYLYKPHIGLSQSFAPNGLKTNYFYDSHQRFSKATDHEGNILQSNFYKVSPTENYIVTAKPRIATTNDILAGLYFNSVVDYQYFDGLGRPTQAIGIGQTPDQNSIIKSEIYYDKFNRLLSSLLPVSAGALTYVPIANAKSLAQSFYADVAPTDSTIFEFSPLNRPKVTFGVGNAWRIADKKTQIFYEAGGTEIRNYSVNSSGNIILSGTYPANSLFKKRILDEQGHETIECTDKRGRMIEKRQQLETGVYAHTHYIYDGLGRPKAIIQPMGYELNTGFTYNSTDFHNWVFFYNYDFRGRNDLKHVPAAGFTKMIYDKKDRLVMQQDALQATLDKWNFQKYDAFDREVFRGETVNSNSQSVLQSAFNTHTAPDEVWSSGGGYNGGSFPAIANPSANDVQHYTFYDQYDFVAALNTNFNFDAGNSYHTKHSSANGLQTGSVSYNLADHNQYFMSASYFDTKNRPIQSFETHVLSPTLPNRADVEYNFSGEVLKNRTLHKQVGEPDITELYENEYDHVGRPIKIFHTLNGIKIEISRFTYDPIGRQISKKIKAGFTYMAGISDIIIRNSEPPTNTQDYVRRNIQLNPGFVYCPDSLAPSLYLGQVDTLGLGGTTDALQTIDYSYNIRNGLRCINCTNDLMTSLNQTQNDLFGMKLDFHETGVLFDGNIQKQSWIKANDNIQRSYTYNYDFSKRLKSATFVSPNNEDFSLPSMSYDKNGNIHSLARKANIGGAYGLVDDLTYSYLGNRLLKVEDAIADTSKNYFNNRNTGLNDFDYYSNGNLKKDLNEGISQINYNNYLNQPIELQKSDGNWEKSFYDGSGKLFKRTNSLGTTWAYIGNFIYKNDTLYQISIPEGIISFDKSGNPNYQFEYRDLTGNLRLMYQDPTVGNPSIRMAPEIVQSQDYEPFGVGFNEYFGATDKNRFGYSNHELVEDLGLNRIDFGQRVYSPTIGRFDKTDRFSAKYSSLSNYSYTANNPVRLIDINGDSLWINYKGNSYRFENGNLNNSNGNTYSGKVKGFLKQTFIAMNQMNTTQTGSSMLGDLSSSNNNFYIQKSTTNEFKEDKSKVNASYAEQINTDNTFQHLRPAPNGGAGGTIYWNSKGANVWTTSGYQSNATTNLGHELFHAYDANNGLMDGRLEQNLKRNEWQASFRENLLRGELGLPFREYYRSQNNNGTFSPLAPRLLDVNNNNVKPYWLPK